MSLFLNCLWSILFPSPQHVTFTESPAIPKADGDFGSSLQWLATQWRRKSSSSHKCRWFPPPHTSPYLQDQQCITHFLAPTSPAIVPAHTFHFSPLLLVWFFFALVPLPQPTAWIAVKQGDIGWGKPTQSQQHSSLPASLLPRGEKSLESHVFPFPSLVVQC